MNDTAPIRTEPIPLSLIIEDVGLQIRDQLDKQIIATYAEVLEQLPPVVVFETDRKGETRYLLADGYHRLAAHKQKGKAQILADIHQGSEREARVYAVIANCKHGLPLNRAEKRKAVDAMLKLHTERADTWIASDLGISPNTVIAIRGELESSMQIAYSDSLLGQDGRWYSRQRAERKPITAPSPQAELMPVPAPKPEPLPPPDPWQGKLICADCIEWLADDETMYDLIFADPPYGILDEDWEPADLLAFTRSWLRVVLPRLKSSGRLYVCFSQRYMLDLKPIVDDLAGTSLTFGGVLIWNYRNVFNKKYSKMSYKPTYEPVFYWHGPDAPPLRYDTDWNEERGDVWQLAMPQSNYKDEKIHPAQKPLELLKGVIRTATDWEDKILDPFGGAGTTAIAAQELGRLWRVIEQDPKCVDGIRARLKVYEPRKGDRVDADPRRL